MHVFPLRLASTARTSAVKWIGWLWPYSLLTTAVKSPLPLFHFPIRRSHSHQDFDCLLSACVLHTAGVHVYESLPSGGGGERLWEVNRHKQMWQLAHAAALLDGRLRTQIT